MNSFRYQGIWRYVVLLCLLFAVPSCDRGLAPPFGNPVLSGKISFRGTWPPSDSVKNLVLVLVPNKPPYKVADLIVGVSNKSILPILLSYRSSDTTFTYDLKPGSYGYLGVAQQFSDSIFRDWRAVGFAHDDRDSARSFDLHLGDKITDANIVVNFDSLPWQPFVP